MEEKNEKKAKQPRNGEIFFFCKILVINIVKSDLVQNLHQILRQ